MLLDAIVEVRVYDIPLHIVIERYLRYFGSLVLVVLFDGSMLLRVLYIVH